jgi:hypothetical protein
MNELNLHNLSKHMGVKSKANNVPHGLNAEKVQNLGQMCRKVEIQE